MLWPKAPEPKPDDRPTRLAVAARILERVAGEHALAHARFNHWLRMRHLLPPGQRDECRFVPWTDKGA